MKAGTLAVLAGVGAPLIAVGSVSGGFIGISTCSEPNPFGLLVINLYAHFDRPGEDLFQSAVGTANSPMMIEVIGGTFYNHFAGTDRPPLAVVVDAIPSLAYDSYVTIGVKQVGDPPYGQPTDDMSITPGFPGVSGASFGTTTSGWSITPDRPAADPFHPAYFDGDGRVLIGRFSTADGNSITGAMLIAYVSNGKPVQTNVAFFHGGGTGECDPFCPADVDDDGEVGITDFLDLLAAWGPNPGHPADIDVDGAVGINDFMLLLAAWGPCG